MLGGALTVNHEPYVEHYVKVTSSVPYTSLPYTSPSVDSVVKTEVVTLGLPAGQMLSDWIEVKAQMNDGVATKTYLTPIQFLGAHLDSEGRTRASTADTAPLVWDRPAGTQPPKVAAARIREYREWFTRTIDSRTSTDDPDYGISGLLRTGISQLSNSTTKRDVALENTHLSTFVNLDDDLFKIRITHLSAASVPTITIVPVNIVGGQEVDGTPVDIQTEQDDAIARDLVSKYPILLYDDPNSTLQPAQIAALVPANTQIIRCSKIKLKIPADGQDPGQVQTSGSLEAKQLQIKLADGGASLAEHDPTQPDTVTNTLTAGTAVHEPQSNAHRFYFQIDADDNTPDIRFALQNDDGSRLDLDPAATVDWYLLYKFKAGSWTKAGARFDVAQWHKLTPEADNHGLVKFRDVNEVHGQRFPGFQQGGFQPGDYRLFARVRYADGKTLESNLVCFKILGVNPANAGRIGGAQTVAGALPTTISSLIDSLPAASFDGREMPELKRWYKAIICRESGFAPYSFRQTFDQFERVTETTADIGYGRSVLYQGQQVQWNVRHAFPISAFDNGWGLSQQTGSQNQLIQFGRWRANVIEGWFELGTTKTAEARNYIKNTLYPGVATANIPATNICKEVVARYNGGHYYIRSGNQVAIDTSGGNTEYIDAVQPYYDHLTD